MSQAIGRLSGKGDAYHILLGKTKMVTDQWGIIGTAPRQRDAVMAIDLDTILTILLLGVQGSGKSYTLQLLMEMGLIPLPGVNKLVQPLASIYFYWQDEQNLKPEAVAMGRPNPVAEQVAALRSQWGASPKGVEDVIVLVPRLLVETRRREMPGVKVMPLEFSFRELSFPDIQTLMGAVSDQESDYIQAINLILESYTDKPEQLNLETLRAEIAKQPLDEQDIRRANLRIKFLSRFIAEDPAWRLGSVVAPGRLVVVDLRSPNLTEAAAFRLIIALLHLLGQVRMPNGKNIPKQVIFDEFHQYCGDAALVKQLIKNVRLMRHYSTSCIFASQDPILVPLPIIEFASIIFANRIISPRHKAHLATANDAFSRISITDLDELRTGLAWVWARDMSDAELSKAPQLVRLRTSASEPGGATKTASSAAQEPPK